MSGLDLLLYATLLALSAGFSASETALFSLGPEDRIRAGPRVGRLLDDPRSLLISILMGNLVVNLLFFAYTAGGDHGGGGASAWIAGGVALAAVLLFGEILPKTLALRARVPIARQASVPLSVLVRVLSPVRRAVDAALELTYRALGDAAAEERSVTPALLAQVLEHGEVASQLETKEAALVSEIIELRGIRVREIMQPRVDVLFIDADGGNRDEVTQVALAGRVAWLLVTGEGQDDIRGRVALRKLLAKPETPVGELLQPIRFVPEMASAIDLLRQLREAETTQAVVVDEWGGTAGLVSLEDVFEEIVGDLRTEGEARATPVVPLGEGRLRVDGRLSLRDWNEMFGKRVTPMEFETVGGYVTALLGRIPRMGDEVEAGPFHFTVHNTRGRRIVTVDVGAASTEDADGGGQA